jgi:ketosteroid isomerase-like protein
MRVSSLAHSLLFGNTLESRIMANCPLSFMSRGPVLATLIALGTLAVYAEPNDQMQAVRDVLERQVADWNRGNLDAFLDGYWNSPKVVFQSGGNRFDGWEALRARYRRRYQEEGRAMGQLVFSGLEIEPLGAEAALARGQWRLTMPDGTKPGGLFTVIFRKFPKGWKIVHDHTSAEEPARSDAKPAKPTPE